LPNDLLLDHELLGVLRASKGYTGKKGNVTLGRFSPGKK